jgi:hypothetical protein
MPLNSCEWEGTWEAMEQWSTLSRWKDGKKGGLKKNNFDENVQVGKGQGGKDECS